MAIAAPGEITLLLNRKSAGDRQDLERLADLVFGELRRIASRVMVSEPGGHTLQPTAVATDAYLKLLEQEGHNWQNREQYFALAAQTMRQLLLDYGRKRRAQKRGGEFRKVELDLAGNVADSDFEELLAVDQALQHLFARDPRQSRVVELRYFMGLTEEETAAVIGVSLRTVKREWAVARAWLHAELTAAPRSAAN